MSCQGFAAVSLHRSKNVGVQYGLADDTDANTLSIRARVECQRRDRLLYNARKISRRTKDASRLLSIGDVTSYQLHHRVCNLVRHYASVT